MIILKNHKYLGLEYDWIALDRSSNIGYFSTAGFGPIPQVAMNQDHDFDILKEVLKMPEIFLPKYNPKPNYNISDWISISRRGIFAYDWSQDLNLYQQISIPSCAINSSEIKSEAIKSLASEVILSHVFLDSTFLTL